MGETLNTNPFAGLEVLFAADQEPVRYNFEVMGQACHVTLRPMDASAEARFRSKGQAIEVNTTTRTVETARVVVDQDELELELLVGTVVDYCFAKRMKVKGSNETVVGLTTSDGRTARDRKLDFKELTREFRQILVRLACEVNGLDPNSVGLAATSG